MNGWLAAAEKLFPRRASRPPLPFELTCACGHIVAGTRTEVIQRPVCPDCGTELFVLPASVYPLPRALQRKPPAPLPQKSTEEHVDGGLEAPDAAGPAPKVLKTAAVTEPPLSESRALPGPSPVRTPRRSLRQAVGESSLALH